MKPTAGSPLVIVMVLTLVLPFLSLSPAGADPRETGKFRKPVLGTAPEAPSGITGLKNRTLNEPETHGEVILPKGAVVTTLADGTLVYAQLKSPCQIAGMALKSPATLHFKEEKLSALEIARPQWIKGYPVEGRVEFHPNLLPASLQLSEDTKIQRVAYKKGSKIRFSLAGIPLTDEMARRQKKCEEVRGHFHQWLDQNVKYECEKDSDCMIQKLLPYTCAEEIVVRVPGFPSALQAELEKQWAIIRKDCELADPKSVTCERFAISAKCIDRRCQNGH